MSKLIDLTGKRFNKLVVLERMPNGKKGRAYWKCQCDCGNTTIVSGGNLKNGGVKSCGCLRHQPSYIVHNKSHTPLYGVWNNMKNRCTNIHDKSYKNYGGRGISICEEWKNSFQCFYDWSIKNGYKEGLTIERIDNDGNYCPENCKWIIKGEQVNNRRNNQFYTYQGKTQTLGQWCKELNLDYGRIHGRITYGNWTFERAISTPIDVSKRNKKARNYKDG